MSAFAKLCQWFHWLFLAYEPMRHARWELIIMRIALVLLVWDMHSGWTAEWTHPVKAVQLMVENPFHWDIVEKSQPHPNGFGMFMDFSFLSNDSVEGTLRVLTAISLVLYAIGLPGVFTLFIPLAFNVGIATLKNSQGAIGHTAQAVYLVLLSVWAASAWAWWCRRKGRGLPHEFTEGQLEADWARQALASAYVVSAISKIIFSKGAWIASTRYLPLHIVKNRDMEYYEQLKPEALNLAWLPQLMMDHQWLSATLFGIALPLELFAFWGLYNRRSAAIFGIGLIGFHESVTQLMSLSFIYNKALLLVLFVGPWWWVARWLGKSGKNELPA
ncbi:MAG: hypothetical protein JNM99_02280 [Verrucomicrobiaceae bacterium]|nr:hypothetical protein [Verrucomicrobiaceae bacterium]